MKIIDDSIKKLKQLNNGFNKLSFKEKIYLAISVYLLYKLVNKMVLPEKEKISVKIIDLDKE